jgi:hypothetical protein
MSSSMASQKRLPLLMRPSFDSLGSEQAWEDLLRICNGQLWFLMLLA